MVALPLLFQTLATARYWAQSAPQPDPWDLMVVRADRVQACSDFNQAELADPAAQAISLYREAIKLVDRAPSPSLEESQRRGAFRASVVRRISILSEKRGRWLKAIASASALHQKHSLDRAEETLRNTDPLPCWKPSTTLLAAIADERRTENSMVTEAENLSLEAQSSSVPKMASKLYLAAIAKYMHAQELNIDDGRTMSGMAQAKSQNAIVSSLSSHEILVLSRPGAASLVLRSGGETWSCSATPCKFPFDGAYFKPTGGRSIDSKRLAAPIVATLSKPGYGSKSITLTAGPYPWTAYTRNGRVRMYYYYFPRQMFRAELVPLPSR